MAILIGYAPSSFCPFGAGALSRKTLVHVAPRVCATFNSKWEDLNQPQIGPKPVLQWASGMMFDSDNVVQQASPNSSSPAWSPTTIVIQTEAERSGRPSTDIAAKKEIHSILLAVSFTISTQRIVGTGTAKADKRTFFVLGSRSISSELRAYMVMPSTGDGKVFFRITGTLVNTDAVLKLLKISSKRHLKTQFGHVLDVEDPEVPGLALNILFDADRSVNAVIRPEDLVTTEIRGEERIIVEPVVPVRKRKLLLRKK